MERKSKSLTSSPQHVAPIARSPPGEAGDGWRRERGRRMQVPPALVRRCAPTSILCLRTTLLTIGFVSCAWRSRGAIALRRNLLPLSDRSTLTF